MAWPSHHLRQITKALRHVRGGMVAGEMLRRRLGPSDGHIRITDFDGGLSMELDLAEHMQNQIYWYGYYSLDLVPLFKRILRPGCVMIDCGANIGELSLVARNVVGENGHVFAFEPLPQIASQLQSNLDANGFLNVTVIRKGVSNQATSAPIFEASERSSDGLWNRGLGSLYSSSERCSFAGSIELVTLDSFAAERRLNRLDLIKLDIEGGELAALQGARHLLSSLKPALVIEVNERMCTLAGHTMKDMLDFIQGADYSVYRVGRRGALEPLSAGNLRPFQNLYCVPQV